MRAGECDVAVIGCGIVGAMAARELSRYALKVIVLEAEEDLGLGSSAANSAIIHAGYDPKPGTLKARLDARGVRLWERIIPELGVDYRNTGSYVVALGEGELPDLETLFRQGVENGAPGLRLIGRRELLAREPLLNPRAAGALFAPSAGVVDPFAALLAAAEVAAVNGAEFRFGSPCVGIVRDEEGRLAGVETPAGTLRCRYAVNAAGLFSDKVVAMADPGSGFEIVPRRGEYLVFDPARLVVNNVLFRVPTDKGKGILVSTTTHGNVMIGPNAFPVADRSDSATSRAGLAEIVAGAKELVPRIEARDAIASFAGVRATGNLKDRDFLIGRSAGAPGLVHAAGIDSPGFASAPAIAEEVVGLLAEGGLALEEKKSWNGRRVPPPRFARLSHREREELAARDGAYGRIVCRCEQVTEGEVLAALRSPVPARSYDGVKRRTWLGTGRCQGGFDTDRVIAIMARELGLPPGRITKRGRGSEFVLRGTKDAP